MSKGTKKSKHIKSFEDLKKKYLRSIIKLGNSQAITFPQDWTEIADLKEKSEVSLYPIDQKTIVIRASENEKKKTVFNLDSNKWPTSLVKQAIVSAFKLNVDEIYLKFYEDNQEKLYEILTDLQKEIIGFDFKSLIENQSYFIHFLLDTSKIPFLEVILDLAKIFQIIINNILKGESNKNNDLLLAEIDRKFSLGRRILITGLSEYPISRGYRNLPIIQFLGDRVILLYIKDFINESLTLQNYPQELINKFKNILQIIPELLIEIIDSNDRIDLEHLSSYHDKLINLNTVLEKIKVNQSFEEIEIRNSIKYYLNSFQNFFDISMTRLIESEIGMV